MFFLEFLSVFVFSKERMKGFKEGLLRARESEVAFGGVGIAFSTSKKKHFNFLSAKRRFTRGRLRLRHNNNINKLNISKIE